MSSMTTSSPPAARLGRCSLIIFTGIISRWDAVISLFQNSIAMGKENGCDTSDGQSARTHLGHTYKKTGMIRAPFKVVAIDT